MNDRIWLYEYDNKIGLLGVKCQLPKPKHVYTYLNFEILNYTYLLNTTNIFFISIYFLSPFRNLPPERLTFLSASQRGSRDNHNQEWHIKKGADRKGHLLLLIISYKWDCPPPSLFLTHIVYFYNELIMNNGAFLPPLKNTGIFCKHPMTLSLY